jgi:hypothetical protein
MAQHPIDAADPIIPMVGSAAGAARELDPKGVQIAFQNTK